MFNATNIMGLFMDFQKIKCARYKIRYSNNLDLFESH